MMHFNKPEVEIIGSKKKIPIATLYQIGENEFSLDVDEKQKDMFPIHVVFSIIAQMMGTFFQQVKMNTPDNDKKSPLNKIG